MRIPALYNGLFGVRPTNRRFSISGHMAPSNYTPINIFPAVGPMTKHLEDSLRVMEAFQNQELLARYDGKLVPMPWRSEEVKQWAEQKQLRVGVIRNLKVAFIEADVRYKSGPEASHGPGCGVDASPGPPHRRVRVGGHYRQAELRILQVGCS